MNLTLNQLQNRWSIMCEVTHIDKTPDEFISNHQEKWLEHRRFFNFVIGHLDAEVCAAQVAYQAVCDAARLAGEDEDAINKWKEEVRPAINRYNRYRTFSH